MWLVAVRLLPFLKAEPELRKVGRTSGPGQAHFLSQTVRIPHRVWFPELNKEGKATWCFIGASLPNAVSCFAKNAEGTIDYQILSICMRLALSLGKLAIWRKVFSRVWPLSPAARTASVQRANAFMCLEWAAYGNYDRVCFPITGSMFSLHRSRRVPSAAGRGEGACPLLYGGDTDEPL